MKMIKTISGEQFIISDEEAKKIWENIENIKFIYLKSGEIINVASISCILNYEDDYLNKYLN